MTWPSKRIQRSALMRWEDSDALDPRVKAPRKRETRRMVRETISHPRRERRGR